MTHTDTPTTTQVRSLVVTMNTAVLYANDTDWTRHLDNIRYAFGVAFGWDDTRVTPALCSRTADELRGTCANLVLDLLAAFPAALN